MEDNTKGKHEIEEGRIRYKYGLKLGRKQKEGTVNSEMIAEKSKKEKKFVILIQRNLENWMIKYNCI